jgi:hypothetical protein
MFKEKAEDDAKLAEMLAKAVGSLARDEANAMISSPLPKALNEEQKTMLKAALPTGETIRWTGCGAGPCMPDPGRAGGVQPHETREQGVFQVYLRGWEGC